MILCKVCDKCVSTIKNKELAGLSFVVVKKIDSKGKLSGECFLAVDPIGCGNDETVMVVCGSGARIAISNDKAPIDAAVIGIVDEKNFKEKQ